MSGGLRQRVITAVLLAAVLIGVLLALPVVATRLLLFAMVVAGAWEWSAFVQAGSPLARAIFVAVVAALLLLVWSSVSTSGLRRVFLGAAALWWCAALLWMTVAPQRVAGWSAALAGVLALVPMGAALLWLRELGPRGGGWALLALVLVWAADTGGYFAGRRYGRHPLAPRVSPAKTWEGVWGGVALGVPAALAGAALLGAPPLPVVVVGLVAIGFSVVGDLTESMLKRHAGVKDSGWLIPGHGGIMDRIDSVTAAAPVFLFGLMLTGVSP